MSLISDLESLFEYQVEVSSEPDDDLDYAAAEQYCIGHGSQLITIKNAEQFEAVKVALDPVKQENFFYIGLYRDHVNATEWKWKDGSPVDYGFTDGDGTQPTIATEPWGNSFFHHDGCGVVFYHPNQDTFRWWDHRCTGGSGLRAVCGGTVLKSSISISGGGHLNHDHHFFSSIINWRDIVLAFSVLLNTCLFAGACYSCTVQHQQRKNGHEYAVVNTNGNVMSGCGGYSLESESAATTTNI